MCFYLEEMNIVEIIQNNPNPNAIRKMLEDMKLHLQTEISDVQTRSKKIIDTLSPIFFTDFPNYQKQVEKLTLPFRQSHNQLIEHLAFVESMIQKLSQPKIELTDGEELFLGRLFLTSKHGSPKSIRSELGEYSKKLKSMSYIIWLTLSRYKSITTMWNSECSWSVIRTYLCQTRQAQEFYETTSFNNLTWEIKSEKEEEYNNLAKELADLALKYCVEKLDFFMKCFSDFKFEKLMSDFEGCVSKFSDQFPNSIIDFFFSQENSDFSNQLLESLLTLESTFLDEKKKLQEFYKQFQEFLNEIKEKLTPIFHKQREYETRDFGDCHRAHSGYQYVELYPELKYLIMKLTAVLENKCQNTCRCNHLTPEDHRQMMRPDLYGVIVHTRVVMTPVETEEVDKLVRDFFARFH